MHTRVVDHDQDAAEATSVASAPAKVKPTTPEIGYGQGDDGPLLKPQTGQPIPTSEGSRMWDLPVPPPATTTAPATQPAAAAKP